MNWSFLKQPTTILGLSGVAVAATGLAAHFAGIEPWVSACMGIGVGSLVHVVMPDNSDAQTAIEKIVTDTVREVCQRRMEAEYTDMKAAAIQVVSDVPAAVATAITKEPTGGGVATFPGSLQAAAGASSPRTVPGVGRTALANQGQANGADKAAAAKPLDLAPFAVKG